MAKQIFRTKGIRRLLIILLIPSILQAQTFNDRLPSLVFTALSGIASGAADGFRYHCDQCGDFWNGKNSWLNKYQNRDPRQGPAYFGSTTFLAFTTDGVHLSDMASRQFSGFALATTPNREKRGFWRTIGEAAIYQAAYLIPRTMVLELAFKQRIQ